VHPHGFDRHGTVPPGGPGSCPVSATGVGEQRGIPAAVRGTGDAVRRFGAGGSVGTGPPAPVAPRTPLSGPAPALCATPRHPATSRPETFRPPAGRRVSRAGGPARAGPPGHGRGPVSGARAPNGPPVTGAGGPPLHGRGFVRHFTGAGWSAPSRPWVGPPRHGRGSVRPVTGVGSSAPSRTRVGPPLHGRGLVRRHRGRASVPRRPATDAHRGHCRRTRSAAPPDSGKVSGQVTWGNRVSRERLRDSPQTVSLRPGCQAWTSPAGSRRRPSSSSVHCPEAATAYTTGRGMQRPLPGSAGRVVDAQPDLFLQPPQAGVQRVAHGLLA